MITTDYNNTTVISNSREGGGRISEEPIGVIHADSGYIFLAAERKGFRSLKQGRKREQYFASDYPFRLSEKGW